MPKLTDLKNISASFEDSLLTLEQAWLALYVAGSDRDILSVAAENTALRWAVAIETFISEWFITCLSHDTSRFRHHHEGRMRQSLERTLQTAAGPTAGMWASAKWPSLRLKRNPGVALCRQMLDSAERNLTFDSLGAVQTDAHRLLAPRFAARVDAAIAAGLFDVLEPLSRLRNTLAHRSARSVRELNERIRAVGHAAWSALRKQQVSADGIGVYLSAPALAPRLVMFAAGLNNFRTLLAP